MSAPDTSIVSAGSSDKTGPQITVQKSASVVQATAQQAAATFRTISGGQSSQVRVVMPPVTLMPQAMIKQIESSTGGVRTQITAIPAARTVSQTSITVTRPVTPTTYIPRAGVTTTNIQAQRLASPIRTPTPPTVTGLSGNFVRGTAVARNPSPATTSISPATATWMAASSGQVQLIRAINHQPRQRIIAQNISSTPGGTGIVSVAQATNIANGQNQQSQQPQNQANIQTVQNSQQQTFVATLAAVMPPRQQTATLVYSPSTQTQQYNPTSGPTQRFTVAASLAGNQRQVRPIQLGNRTFPTAKLGVGGMNTTSISIRTPSIPVLAPTINTGSTTSTLQARNATTGNVNLSTATLSTTRIIQLQQQQPGTGTQQIIGPTGRIANNLMLQPIIMNTAGGGKIGIRPPSTLAKVQPSLTITQLGLGKIPTAQQSTGASALTAANIQSASITPSSTNTSNVVIPVSTNIVQQQQSQQQTNIGQPQAINVNVSNNQQPMTQIVSVNQSIGGSGTGQIITTQNVPATVVPLAITPRATNVLAGTITSIKAGVTMSPSISVPQIAKVIPQQQQQQQQQVSQNQHHQSTQSSNQIGQQVTEIITCSHQHLHHQPTSVFIHTRSPSSGSAGTTTVIPSSGTFLPAGGTFYYESVPASSVTVSTGVISLTTTTISTPSNCITVSSSSLPTGIVSSIPYNPPSGTFTVVPSNSRAIVGQIPVSSTSGQTQNLSQIQAVPIRFTSQHVTEQTISISQTSQQTQSLVQSQQQQQLQQQPQQVIQQHQQPQQVIQQQQQQLQQVIQHHQQTQQAIQQQQPQQVIQQQQQPHPQQAIQQQQHPQPQQAIQQQHPQFQQQHPQPQQQHQIITLAQQPQQSQQQHTQPIQQTHMLIPVQTSIKIPTSSIVASSPPRTTTVTSIGTSFFRKRDNEGSPVRAGKNLAPTLLSMTVATQNNQSSSGILAERNKESERPTSPHSRPSSSGSTTVSANSSPGVDQQMTEEINSLTPMNIRTESHFNPINDMYANHQNAVVPGTLSSTRSAQQQIQPQIASISANGNVESTPRKKSRRQNSEAQQTQQTQSIIVQPQHNNQQNVTIQTSQVVVAPAASHDNATKPNNTAINNKENTKPTEYILKKPRTCTLLDGYRQNWKAANNHFQRYSDVKPREERRPSVMDLANQAHVVQKINGWKIYHLSAQMEDLCDIEMQAYEKLESMLKQLESHEHSQDIDRVNELVKGNMQRSKIIVDGVNEARTQIMKIFDHKSHVSDIIHRCASKRNFKKREKT